MIGTGRKYESRFLKGKLGGVEDSLYQIQSYHLKKKLKIENFKT